MANTVFQSPKIKVRVKDSGSLQSTTPVTLKNTIGQSRSLTELNDIAITNPANSDILVYDANSAQWVNRLPPTVTGNTLNFSISNTTPFDYYIQLNPELTIQRALYVGNGFSTNSSVTMIANGNFATINVGSAYIANGIIVNGSAQLKDIIPDANNAYTIGNSTFRYATLWLSGNTFYMGNVVFEDTNTNLSLKTSGGSPISVDMGNTSVNGSLSVTGTFTTESIAANTLTIHKTANLEGNVAIGGQLVVSNTASVGNTIINGTANIQGNVAVGGYATFANAVTINPGTVVGTNETVTSAGMLWSANSSTSLLLTDGGYFRNILKYDSVGKDIWLGHGATSWIDDVVIAAGSATYGASVVLRAGSVVGLTVNATQTSVLTDLSVAGNLTVSGTTTYINTTTLNVGDNIITLNADVSNVTAPTENSGFEVNRGSSANVSLLWNETNDNWVFNTGGTADQFKVATVASAVNYLEVGGGATTVWPTVVARGSDTNIGIAMSTKGNGGYTFGTNSNFTVQFGVTHTASAVNYISVTGAATGSGPTITALGADANVALNITSKANSAINILSGGVAGLSIVPPFGGYAAATRSLEIVPAVTSLTPIYIRASGSGENINYSTQGSFDHQFVSGGGQQFLIKHTASAVNYIQATGAATGGAPTISAQGSDAAVDLTLTSKTTGVMRLQTGGVSVFRLRPAGSAVNYFDAYQSATGKAPYLQSVGSDTNVPFAILTQGTGGIDLAAGSSGVNISNGGTVTALTRTASGSGYTSAPALAITAPTTASGVQATATCTIGASTATVVSGGTGYTLNDVITVSGGTFGTAAVGNVTGVSGGVVTAITLTGFGSYTAFPSSPASTTGGTGTGLTVTLGGGFMNTGFTITNAGSGYVEQPTVSFSGGGGSGAAAYATVGSGTTVRSIGFAMSFNTPAGEGLRVADAGNAGVGYVQIGGGNSPYITSQGTNASLSVSSNGTGTLWLRTNGAGTNQMAVAHTASAVNYLQVTGGATGTGPTLSAQGSDTNADITVSAKGTGVTSSTSPVQIEADTVITTKTLTTTTTTASQVIATFAGATYRSAEFIIQATDTTGTKYQKTKMLAVHNGTTAEYVEYGNVNVGGDCGTFDVSYSAGIQLRVTPASTNSTVFKVTCILTKV